MMLRLIFAFGLLHAALLAGAEPDLHIRRGLHALEAAAGDELRVAYLGGSITAADGWRPLTTARLRSMLPGVTVHEINTALPGTGSDLGVCRLGYDVLRHRPDLVFVEFAVNDTTTPPEQIERTMEGIVRQTWRTAPEADIVFIYTVSTPGLPDLQEGLFPPPAQAMERVAERYGIPSLHLGIEVARRVAAGDLIFKGTAADGDRVFSLDGVHPTAAGHRIYFETLDRALGILREHPKPRPPLPQPLHADNWERSGLTLVTDAKRHGEWDTLPLDDPNLRGSTKALLPATWRTATPGAAVEFTFTGTRFGFLGIAAPDNGEFRVTVDNQPAVDDTFFDAYVSPTFCRQRAWFYPQTLSPGPHRVRIELLGTHLDKIAIKAHGKRPANDPQPYADNRLTLCGLLWVDSSTP